MLDSEHCPNCGADLVDTWLHCRVNWSSGGSVTQEIPCPECGWDLTGPDLEAELSDEE